MERVMGIEPTLVAWEATVLPLNYTRAPGRENSRRNALFETIDRHGVTPGVRWSHGARWRDRAVHGSRQSECGRYPGAAAGRNSVPERNASARAEPRHRRQ